MPGLPSTSHQGWHTRGYLPHFDRPGLIQGITFRLADSVPVERIAAWKRELGWIERRMARGKHDPEPEAKDEYEIHAAQSRNLHQLIAAYEDAGAGECYLRKPEIASLVVEALTCFDSQRYELKAFCVMPNHVHALIGIFGEWTTGRILQSWKTWTSRRANHLLQRTGTAFWSPDYFDRFIRDEAHYLRAVHYIHQNPVKAGLVANADAWPWSSAYRSASHDRSADL